MNTSLKTVALSGVIALTAIQASSAAVDIPRKIHFDSIDKVADNTLKVKVSIDEGDANNQTSWYMSSSEKAVFFRKFKSLEKAVDGYSPLTITDPESNYQGLFVTITDTNGKNLIPIRVFHAEMKDERDNLLGLDPMRTFEYWLWSTGAPENLVKAQQMLPIIDFDQCISLGHRLVETTPRQCLLSNGEIFLDVLEKPTQESIAIKSFDDCLVNGQALIDTFPRRCVAAGGHVFAEPPRLRQASPTLTPVTPVQEFRLEDFDN